LLWKCSRDGGWKPRNICKFLYSSLRRRK
jgi:hypothetical protein